MEIVSGIWKNASLLISRRALIETIGLLVLGFGIILAIAIYSYSPSDYIGSQAIWETKNLAGPFGAYVGQGILGYFGYVGLIWPPVFFLWGVLIAFGFGFLPNAKRVVGLIGVLISLAVIAELQGAYFAFAEPVFGFGGKLGSFLSVPLVKHFGYGGALTIAVILATINLIITRNLSTSNVKHQLEFGRYKGQKALKQLKRKALDFKYAEEDRLRRKKNPNLTLVENGAAPKSKETSNSSSAKMNSAKNHVKKVKAVKHSNAETSNSSDIETQLEIDYSLSKSLKVSSNIFKSSQEAQKKPKGFHESMAKKLTNQLAEFKVAGKVVRIHEGPVVTTFEFEPSAGQKVSKITSLSEDLARLLEARSLRILSPIPGKKTLGFEVPNQEVRMVGFKDFISHKNFNARDTQLPIGMGSDTSGKAFVSDLAAMPHLLVAGSTGSGKSVFINTLIASLICRHSPRKLRFVMIDPKMVELAAFNDIPHMACPVVTDPKEDAKSKLDALVAEMDKRYQQFQLLGTRNITGFNEVIKSGKKASYPKYEGRWAPMPYVVLIVDELADLMMTLGKDAETPITRLAQKARAAGIHVVIATQRPSADVVTGLLKANFPTRVAFRVSSSIDSRTILDQSGAELLLGKGDMLYQSSQGVVRLHGAYLSDGELNKLVNQWKKA